MASHMISYLVTLSSIIYFCSHIMKIAICSDSHDHVENISKFCDDVFTRDVDFLIHLGDFISG
jgi:hypothetical protein